MDDSALSTQGASLGAPRAAAGRPQLSRAPGLLRQLDAGDLGRHLDRLYRAAWALCGSREDADDLVQDAYARVLARPRLLRSEDDLAYLLRVLHHTFVSSLRTRARRPRAGASLDEADIAGPSPNRPEEVAEMHAVYAAIAKLAPDFREALVAVDVIGLSYREAAAHLEVKEATLTTRLHRARRRVIAGWE